MAKSLKLSMENMIDGKTLRKTLNCGEYYEMDDNEKACVADHRMGDKSHLLRENFFVHRNGLVITKLLTKKFDIEQCPKTLLHSIGFRARIFLGNDH